MGPKGPFFMEESMSEFNSEYSSLLKEKTKALSIFEKTKKQLFAVCDRIHSEIQANEVRKDQSKQRIKLEEEAIKSREEATVFLEKELETTRTTLEKIEAILN